MTTDSRPTGQLNVLAGLVGIGVLVGGIWVWNHLSFDTQDWIVDDIIPILLMVLVSCLVLGVIVRKVRVRRQTRAQRDRLVTRFEQEPSSKKRLDIACVLIELNEYQLEGLERIATPMAELFISTVKTALGDKQHRIRGMAASYLGILNHQPAIPLLIRSLEDDHAHVRASAALALGRMRALAAKEKLEETMKEDWDQTVRSRSREAFERIQRAESQPLLEQAKSQSE
ncbi:HEAT repeat domain-containing protein [Nitrospira sp. M1]